MRVSVICIGNEYQLDDGFGPAVARYLQERYAFPSDALVLDRAMMGYDIVPDLIECDAAVVVDALDGTGSKAGTIFSFRPEDMAGAGEMMSLHQVRFADVLGAARMMGAAVSQAYCLGVQVEDMGRGALERGLSEPVAAAVAPVARMAVRHLTDTLGIEVQDRWRDPADPRAVLDDPAAYMTDALSALDIEGERAAALMAHAVYGSTDYELDDLIADAVRADFGMGAGEKR